jgi:hypothetical protein
VLIFKMAVALGFDAPRAFTLAALRGARDPGFGVQVIGRIVRRHALLQVRDDLPPLLQHGYVFLANSQSQEGLLDAGAQINALTTRAPELGTQTVVTMLGDTQQVQVVRSGEPLSLLVTPQAVETIGDTVAATLPGDIAGGEREVWTEAARDLLQLAGDEGEGGAQPRETAASTASLLVLSRTDVHRYPRCDDAPEALRSERLPPAPADFEARLVDYVDFSEAVLASRLRTRVQVTSSETDLFNGRAVGEGGVDVWANLVPSAVAHKAEQIRLRLAESNDRELSQRLLARFHAAVEATGATVPQDEEELMQQLDLVLVRHPSLLREAYKRLRHAQILDVDAPLAAELQSDMRLEPARRALFGVYPPGLNDDERAIAAQLDASATVRWWHRNPPRRSESVGLYRWDDGDGFFPDFVVSLRDRTTRDGIALLEVKGDFLWGNPHDVDKAEARHRDYGDVYMVGRERGQREFVYLCKLADRLQSSGGFDVARMRHA